ncbi:MAG TPA: hypothetical protein VEB21_20825, partial [Terriglobales bacterium]|nr:hypothetical protein [Terriglobales bacterium]
DTEADHTTVYFGSCSATGGLSITAGKYAVPGSTVQIAGKIRNMLPPVTIEMQMPAELTPFVSIPVAEFGADNVVRWTLDGVPGRPLSASVKLKALVSPGAIAGQTLMITGSATTASGNASGSRAVTVKAGRAGSGTGGVTTGSTRPLALSLAGARTFKPGLTTSLTLRYRNLTGSGRLHVNLPPALRNVMLTVPPATITPDGQLVWTGLTKASGGVSIRALVGTDITSGEVLPITATITGANNTSASTASLVTVR